MRAIKQRIQRLERAHRNNHHAVSAAEGIAIKKALWLKLGGGNPIPDFLAMAAVSYSAVKRNGSTVREKLSIFLASRIR